MVLLFLMMSSLMDVTMAQVTWVPNKFDTDGDGTDDLTVWARARIMEFNS